MCTPLDSTSRQTDDASVLGEEAGTAGTGEAGILAPDASADLSADSSVFSAEAGSTPMQDSGLEPSSDSGTGNLDAGPSTMPESCAMEGAERCGAAGGASREKCSGGAWLAAAACGNGEVCQQNGGATVCKTISEACVGSAGQAVCVGAELVSCGADAVPTSTESCSSAQHCERGLPSGKCAKCLQSEHHCEGAELQKCADDGQRFIKVKDCATAALCNEQAKDCTDAFCQPGPHCSDRDVLQSCNASRTAFQDEKVCNAGLCDEAHNQCDICAAGSRRCDQSQPNVAKVCSSDGQSEQTVRCDSRCAGGKCVACIAPEDCDEPDECKTRTCDGMGACGTGNAPFGTRCSHGSCNGLGTCMCLTNSNCGGTNVCKNGSCVANRCGDGVTAGNEECDDGNIVDDDACSNLCQKPKCGDNVWQKSAGEECESGTPGWNYRNCSNQCKIIVYTDCTSDSQCDGSYSCTFGGCESATTCNTTGCVPLPGYQVTCGAEVEGNCMIDCSSNGGKCPGGLKCTQLGSRKLCMISGA